MYQASVYSKLNSLQKNEAQYLLETYENLIQWKDKENVLDIGSGDGGVTLEILLPRVPESFNLCMGVDLSKEMVRFSNSLSDDPRVSFAQMDIQAKLPEEYKGKFDHIFSCYCLHWVQDQRQTMKNIYELLSPGGQTVLIFLATSTLYDVFEMLSKDEKWGPHLKDTIYKHSSPYFTSKNPRSDAKKLLEEVGFEVTQCKLENRSWAFSSYAEFSKKMTVMSVNGYARHLSENEVHHFLKDALKLGKESNKLTYVQEGENGGQDNEFIQFDYTVLLILASKPM